MCVCVGGGGGGGGHVHVNVRTISVYMYGIQCSVPGDAVHTRLNVWSSYLLPPQCPYALESVS